MRAVEHGELPGPPIELVVGHEPGGGEPGPEDERREHRVAEEAPAVEVCGDVRRTGKNPGRTPKEWREALAGPNQSNRPSKTPMKPTFGEMATLVYQPEFAPIGFTSAKRTQVIVDS